MTVANGELANQTTFNVSFMSREADTDTIGKVDLLNGDTASGASITNLQKEVNNKSFKPFAAQAISGGGTVTTSGTLGMQRRKVISSGGALTASVTPFAGVDIWIDGLQIMLLGTSNTDTLAFVHNDADFGMILNGDIILSKFSQLTVQWDKSELRWFEVTRND